MDLMSLETEDERSNFNSIYSLNFASFKMPYTHIGGLIKTVGKYDRWFWIQNKAEIKIHLNWKRGEPSNSAGIEHCLALEKKDRRSFMFNDIACSMRNFEYFICEQQVVDYTSASM